MTDKNKRDKAQDIFNKSTPFLGKTDRFEKAFPGVKNIRVEVIEEGEGVSKYTNPSIYTGNNLPGEFINCKNPRCYGGGIRIGDQIRFMMADGETYKEFSDSCDGYEGSPKGRKRYGPCDNYFKITITIEYE
jgi:hypothetical protein